jgi:mono/diheme cytochrome c family protein
MYAYLRTLAPVKQAARDNELEFPFNQRILMAFWRTLYFSPGPYQPQANQSQEWNRGAYLIQGLGHCSACHTSRNALGGSIAEKGLGGGMIPMLNWYASPLTSDAETGLGDWLLTDIADLLKTGVSRRGAVFGPMAEVVSGSLQHLSTEDIGAMAVYLKSIPKSDKATEVATVQVAGDTDAVLKQGKKSYEQHCAACHADDGTGAPPVYPSLAGNRALTVQGAVNPIRIVLNGGYPPVTQGNPRPYGMPPFSHVLSDSEVAAVVSYVRASWGNQGAPVSPVAVGRLRGAPLE